MVGLFVTIVASLVVIVSWEYSRVRDAPRSVSRAFKRHLDTEVSVPRLRVAKEVKRGFDAWD
jgi:hypothetical protein